LVGHHLPLHESRPPQAGPQQRDDVGRRRVRSQPWSSGGGGLPDHREERDPRGTARRHTGHLRRGRPAGGVTTDEAADRDASGVRLILGDADIGNPAPRWSANSRGERWTLTPWAPPPIATMG